MLKDQTYLQYLRQELNRKFFNDLKNSRQNYVLTDGLSWNEEEISIFSNKVGISRRTIIDYLKKDVPEDFRFPNSDTFDLVCQYLGYNNLKEWQQHIHKDILQKEIERLRNIQEDVKLIENEKRSLEQQLLVLKEEEHLRKQKTKETDEEKQKLLYQLQKKRNHQRLSIGFLILVGLILGTIIVWTLMESIKKQALLKKTEQILMYKDSIVYYWNQGYLNEAIACCKKVLTLHPDDQITREELDLLRIEKILIESKNGIYMATASHDGTFYQLGEHIREITKDKIPINVLETEGSSRNFQLLQKNLTPLGILQYNSYSDEPNFAGNVMKWIKTGRGKEIFPIYHQEFHLLIHRRMKDKIKGIQDLNDPKWRVVVGDTKGGSYHNIQRMKKDLELEWTDVLLHFGKEGFEALRQGKADALMCTLGSPGNIKAYLGNDLLFVPVESNQLDQSIFYKSSVIPANIYYSETNKFQHPAISTFQIAKPSYIVSINFEKPHPFYQVIYDLVYSILENEQSLKKMHPVWNIIFTERLFEKEEYFSELHPASREAIQDWKSKNK